MIDTDRFLTLVDRIWNKGDLDAVDELYAENFTGHDPQNPLQGRDAMRAYVQEARSVVPDFHINFHETFSQGDMSVTRWTISGTQSKEWRGIPPTGRTFVITGMTMSKFDGDKIVEGWVNADYLGMLTQLGVIPEQASAM